MQEENHYDYIILGAGLAGLMLACTLGDDPFFKNKKILLIDKQDKTINDRTWCFWLKGTSEWEAIISKKWGKIGFKSHDFTQEIDIKPYHYNKIEGSDFYAFCFKKLQKHPNIHFRQERLLSLHSPQNGGEKEDRILVTTEAQTYTASKVFTSILPPRRLEDQKKHQVLNQHFIGWFVETENPVFDPKTAIFMDFSVAQKGNTRFIYVLPTSPTEALVEYTLFSEKLLPNRAYKSGIEDFLLKNQIHNYEIVKKEQGCIPMTAYPFEKYNGKNIMHIGTAGGWTRGSTGFTFRYSEKRTAQLVDFLKHANDLRDFKINDRYRWYDKLFLDVLYKKNEMGSTLFSAMFRHNPIDRIFRFLDGESSLKEDLQIIWSLPKKEFLRAFFRKGFIL